MLVRSLRAMAFVLLLLLAVPSSAGGLGERIESVTDPLPVDPGTPPSVDPQDPGGSLPVQPPVEETKQVADAAIATAVHTVQSARDTVLTMLPTDPVGFVNEKIAPVRHTAEQAVQVVVYEAPQPEPQAPPATATVTEVPFGAEQTLLVASATAAAAAALAVLWLAGSSGSVGAGAAGAASTGGKIAATDLKRLLPFASPLFTRFEKDTVLGHPKRESLYALILQSPGVSLQSLCDSTGLSRTAVTHHLRLLELQHLIVSKRMGRSRHYYENGGRFGRDQKEALAVLQNQRSKEVATFVKEHPGSIQKALCEALGLQPSIAHWHLSRLQQAQLVESVRSGRTVAYFPGAGLQSLDHPVVPAGALLATPTAV